jgi:anti-anti-sigma factor
MTLFVPCAPLPTDLLQGAWEAGIAFRHLKGTLHQDVVVLSITSAQLLDDAAADGLGQELRAAVTGCGARKIVLDFQAVRALSGAACAVLTSLHDLVRQRGGRLLLCGLTANVAEVLRLTGVLSTRPSGAGVLKAVQDVTAAVARLNAQGTRPSARHARS